MAPACSKGDTHRNHCVLPQPFWMKNVRCVRMAIKKPHQNCSLGQHRLLNSLCGRSRRAIRLLLPDRNFYENKVLNDLNTSTCRSCRTRSRPPIYAEVVQEDPGGRQEWCGHGWHVEWRGWLGKKRFRVGWQSLGGTWARNWGGVTGWSSRMVRTF